MYEEIFFKYKFYTVLDKNTFKEKHDNKIYYLKESFVYLKSNLNFYYPLLYIHY